MIQITPQTRIFVAIQPVDFRKGIDGLCSICREKIKIDPFCGYMFVFRNRKSTAIKILIYDGQGFWLCQKRLSEGFFQYWPDRKNDELVCHMNAHELGLLIWNGNFKKVDVAPLWKKLPSQHPPLFLPDLRSTKNHAIVMHENERHLSRENCNTSGH